VIGWLLWTAVYADELRCDLRGLAATIRYDASGHIELFDGDEPLTEVQASPFDLGTMAGASCVGDEARFVWGVEGSATMAVEKQHVDFGPILDVLAADRFDVSLAPYRRARYHGRRGDPAGVWRWVEGHEGELTADQRQQVARWLGGSEERAHLEAAWSLRTAEARQRPAGQALGLQLAHQRRADGDLDDAEALYQQLTETVATCEGLAAVHEARGDRGPARRQRKRCAELADADGH